MLGKAFSTHDRQFCQTECQQDSKCRSVTFNGPNSANPNICVLNYGPTIQGCYKVLKSGGARYNKGQAKCKYKVYFSLTIPKKLGVHVHPVHPPS